MLDSVQKGVRRGQQTSLGQHESVRRHVLDEEGQLPRLGEGCRMRKGRAWAREMKRRKRIGVRECMERAMGKAGLWARAGGEVKGGVKRMELERGRGSGLIQGVMA